MEEILASIRRIISEDDEPEQAGGEAAPQEDTAPDPEPEPMPEPEPEPQFEADPAPMMDAMEDEPEPEPEFEPEPEPAPPPPPPAPKPVAKAVPQEDVLELTNVVQEGPKGDPYIDLNRPTMQSQRIVSDQPAMSSSEYFARLAIIAQERGQLGGSITVEELARELMRPMLQFWLDENLPRIVERQVQNEIERIVRKAHDL